MTADVLPIDDDAVLWSAPESDLKTRPLVVLLHGRGSNERDLFSLVPLLGDAYVYASVRAPIEEGPGWSWFGSGLPGLPDAASARSATAGLSAWLDRVAPTRGVGVVGFSQGGAMGIELLRFEPERIDSVVNLAGFVIDDGRPTDTALVGLGKPVFWGRDPADPVIPASAIERTRSWLPRHSTMQQREYAGIGHSVSREEIDDVAAFLETTLKP